MVFTSPIFLFFFLPLFLSIYYLVPFRYRSAIILLGSYFFYAWWRVDFLFLFFAITVWTYSFGYLIDVSNSEDNQEKRKLFLAIGVVGNLFALALFKYANFGLDSLNVLLNSMNAGNVQFIEFILPIGISFYIFQSVSYLIDISRKDATFNRNFVDFAAFLSLFPQLIAGPVLRYKDLAHQFQEREHSFAIFTSGAVLFMQGFVKKVLLADSVAPIADFCFAQESLSVTQAWVGALAYSIQLYFDFSGYSDMAVGIGLMMGFRFVNNFNQPYISQSITEFWRRWHISLSNWLRDYLYISLGGNRSGAAKTYRNLFLTMLLGGLWHGANWTFVLWGAWHGMWLAIERFFGFGKHQGFRFFAWLYAMFIVVIGWVMFRSESLDKMLSYYKLMFGLTPSAVNTDFSINIQSWSVTMLIVASCWALLLGAKQHVPIINRFFSNNGVVILSDVVLVPVFFLAICLLIASSYSPFLYFQF